MKKTMTGLMVAVVTVGTAICGLAGPAQASTTKCGQTNLRPDLNVVVLTCGEAEGNLRRARTVLINNSTQAIFINQLQALISAPAYGTGNCRDFFSLAVGQTVHCLSPWVAMPPPGVPVPSGALVFSLIRAVDGRQEPANGIFNFFAPF